MKDFVLTGEGIVGPSWIDDNDHMNMMWYTHLVDLATRQLLKAAEISEDAHRFVAARVTMAHRRELRLGASWSTWSGLVSVSENSLTCVHKITSAGVVAARGEITVVPFNEHARGSIALTGDMVARASRFLVDGLATSQ